MRYVHWDVLLFPGSSRIPLQEFNVKCHVLSDHNNRFIDNAAFNSNPYLNEFESMSQVPVLTSFVASLEAGSPFRVSIHSWEAPKPSQMLRSFKTQEEKVAYEARVYIDGVMTAHRVFSNKAVWPEVIEYTGNIATGHTKPLRFPDFHSEILDQAHWTPGETYGRIRIVIAEGVTGHVNDGKKGSIFDRLRDIVTFSFQHAPRHILEHSEIAWPNPQMYKKVDCGSSQSNIANRIISAPDFEAHAHSPQRCQPRNSSTSLLELSSIMSRSINGEGLKKTFIIDDPFVGPTPICLRGGPLRVNSEDAVVQDYNSIRTARSHAGTEMSGISCAKPNFERAMNEAAIEEIVEALSPERKQDLLLALSPGQ